MTSKTQRRFWDTHRQLPESIRATAAEKFRLWRREPFHPSLHFKELTPGLWSVRITRGYRALGRRKGDMIVWFWIGAHDQYERIAGS